ncbi:MAG: response regulator [Limnothrix sp. RL_2_0]|nr:response regulator [Limnothrix sp. RL_2_0]
MPKSNIASGNFSKSEPHDHVVIAQPDCIRENSQQSILLIDDQVGYLELMYEAIAEIDQKLNIYTAKDGEEAWEKLTGKITISQDINSKSKSIFPSLIITDLNLPKLSGLELLARIRKDNYLKEIPVIILSTSQTESDIVQCYQAEANCFITKPDNIDDFFRVIQSILTFWLGIVSLPTIKLN